LSAAAGQAALVMLVGQPGIGKTSLCEQLAAFVSSRDGLPLVGHCYSEGSFRQPYQPFVAAFGSYLQEFTTDALAAGLSASLADLARIVPALREKLHAGRQVAGHAEDDRWRLLRAATDVLHGAAVTRPVLLVLEDLHDADPGTLDMLLYVARNLQRAGLLVVGTYRDVDVDHAHPLSVALGQLHRASNVARMHLRGLSMKEVLRLLAETSLQRVPQPFAELVHRQTDGNPLFVHEMLHFVVEEGLVEGRDGVLRAGVFQRPGCSDEHTPARVCPMGGAGA
jgi:predicted ATPase